MNRPKQALAGRSTALAGLAVREDLKTSSSREAWAVAKATSLMNLRSSSQEEVLARKEALPVAHRAQEKVMISCLVWKSTSWKLSMVSANKFNLQE